MIKTSFSTARIPKTDSRFINCMGPTTYPHAWFRSSAFFLNPQNPLYQVSIKLIKSKTAKPKSQRNLKAPMLRIFALPNSGYRAAKIALLNASNLKRKVAAQPLISLGSSSNFPMHPSLIWSGFYLSKLKSLNLLGDRPAFLTYSLEKRDFFNDKLPPVTMPVPTKPLNRLKFTQEGSLSLNPKIRAFMNYFSSDKVFSQRTLGRTIKYEKVRQPRLRFRYHGFPYAFLGIRYKLKTTPNRVIKQWKAWASTRPYFKLNKPYRSGPKSVFNTYRSLSNRPKSKRLKPFLGRLKWNLRKRGLRLKKFSYHKPRSKKLNSLMPLVTREKLSFVKRHFWTTASCYNSHSLAYKAPVSQTITRRRVWPLVRMLKYYTGGRKLAGLQKAYFFQRRSLGWFVYPSLLAKARYPILKITSAHTKRRFRFLKQFRYKLLSKFKWKKKKKYMKLFTDSQNQLLCKHSYNQMWLNRKGVELAIAGVTSLGNATPLKNQIAIFKRLDFSKRLLEVNKLFTKLSYNFLKRPNTREKIAIKEAYYRRPNERIKKTFSLLYSLPQNPTLTTTINLTNAWRDHNLFLETQGSIVRSISISPLVSHAFVRSNFFHLTKLSFKVRATDLLVSIKKLKPTLRYLVFPDANELKVSVFRHLNRQKNSLISNSIHSSSRSATAKFKSLSMARPNSLNLGEAMGYYPVAPKSPYVTFQKNVLSLPNDKNQSPFIRIRRIRFKPGYSRIWRAGRVSIREILGLTHRYQYRLSPKLQQLYFAYRKTNFHTFFMTNNLGFALMIARFVPDSWTMQEILSSGSVFLNGITTTNPGTRLFVNDFIQLVVHIKYYISWKWMQNYATFRRNRVNKVFYRKFRPSTNNKDIKVVRPLPGWFYDLQYTFSDIPRFYELDYFTLSIFILYDNLPLEKATPSRAYLFDKHMLNMYNWKYIT